MKIYLGEKENETIYEELDNLGNLLIAGGPGTGKTVYLSRLIKELSAKRSPDDLRFVIYDGKGFDYHRFRKLPHLLFPITSDENVDEFKWQLEQLKRIAEDRRGSKEFKPAIIVIIDEFLVPSDCLDVNDLIELAEGTDETNIHFFISSQRPEIFGDRLIAAIKNKICYRVSDTEESKYFLDMGGAQNLRGPGKAIVFANGKPETLCQKPLDGKMYF